MKRASKIYWFFLMLSFTLASSFVLLAVFAPSSGFIAEMLVLSVIGLLTWGGTFFLVYYTTIGWFRYVPIITVGVCLTLGLVALIFLSCGGSGCDLKAFVVYIIIAPSMYIVLNAAISLLAVKFFIKERYVAAERMTLAAAAVLLLPTPFILKSCWTPVVYIFPNINNECIEKNKVRNTAPLVPALPPPKQNCDGLGEGVAKNNCLHKSAVYDAVDMKTAVDTCQQISEFSIAEMCKRDIEARFALAPGSVPVGSPEIVIQDSRNIYTATQAILAENPNVTVDCAADIEILKRRGYKPSPGVTCSGTMSAFSGGYTLSVPDSWKVTPTVVDYIGGLNKSVKKQ